MKRGSLLIVLAVSSLFACKPVVIRGGTGGDTGGNGGSGTGGNGGGECTTAADCSAVTLCVECPGSGGKYVCVEPACTNGQCEMVTPPCP